MATPARILQIQLLSDIRDGVKGINKVDKRLGGLTRSLKGLAVGVGLAFGTKEVLDFANGAVKMADSIDQSEGKLKQLLGRQAKSVKAFAKNSKAIGISRRAALEYTGSLASLMRVQGFNQREAARSSVQWTKLAADMGAFNNADPTEVLEAMRSGLSGEFEPLKRFGVLLNATKVQQYAWSKGIAENGKALTDRQKLLATEGLLLQQTRLQQGQLARESGTLGAVQNRLNARMEDLQASLGKFLLPIYTNVVEFFGKVTDGLLGMATEGWSAGRAIRSILKSLGVPKEDIDKLSANFENLAGAVRKGIEQGDWSAVQTTLADTLSASVATLQDNEGVLTTIAAVALALGTAFATAMFAVRLFITAAQLPFTLAFWGAKSAVGLAVAAVGKTLGLTFAAAMFTLRFFIAAATSVMTALGITEGLLSAARTAGRLVGTAFQAGLVAGLTVGLVVLLGNALRSAITDALNGLGLGGVAGLLNMNPIQPRSGPRAGRRKGFATGTSGAARGWSWVGERGPELVRFRGGERVMDNRSSMRSLGGGPVYNINVSVSPTADQASIGQTIIRALQAASGRDGGVGLKRALAGGR